MSLEPEGTKDPFTLPHLKVKPSIAAGLMPPKIDGDLRGKDILTFAQFDQHSLDEIFRLTEQMREIARYARPSNILAGNIVTLLFYEPSSRTMGSFDAAVKQLGGQTIVVTDPKHYSSVAKGETFADTIRTFESYCDAIVLRHPEIGSALKAAEAAKYVPVINAGDGPGEHPTQTLLDLFTIWERHKRLSSLKGLIAGDIKNGRTVHSLLEGLSLFPENTVFLLSPRELQLKKDRLKRYKKTGLTIYEIDSPEGIDKDCDFWYWTRVQKERFETEEEYLEVNNKFIVTGEFLRQHGSEKMILMHPLPRVGEISEDVDSDRRAVYLRSQIRNGMYTRMALITMLLGKS